MWRRSMAPFSPTKGHVGMILLWSHKELFSWHDNGVHDTKVVLPLRCFSLDWRELPEGLLPYLLLMEFNFLVG